MIVMRKNYVVSPSEFVRHGLIGGFSMKSERLSVSSGIQDSSKYLAHLK